MSHDGRRPGRSSGFTLLELVITIVILGIGASAFIVLINQTTRDSVDPLIQQQATGIAESYLEEILLLDYCDPDNDCSVDCTPPDCVGNCGSPISSASDRPVYDDIFDYRSLPANGVVKNRNDTAVPGLDDFSVTVGFETSGVSLNGLSGISCEVARVNVQVSHPVLNAPVEFSGFKVNFQ